MEGNIETEGSRPVDAQRRAIIVLGMHRSGTSALTRVINLLGADLPSKLLPANWGNELGFFESNELVIAHDELLASAGSDWQDWRAFNPKWYSSPAASEFRQRVLGVLRKDFENSRLFVIKDPRICRFFPFWRDVLGEFGVLPSVAISVRNPLEVMASLRSRDGASLTKTALLWLRHVVDAERTTRDLPRAIVPYDALLSDWKGVVTSLRRELDVSWPQQAAAAPEIERFLVSDLRHHVTSIEELGSAEVAGWVKAAYAALMQLSRTPQHNPSRTRLDRVRREFDKASLAFGAALAEGESNIARHEAESSRLRSQTCALEERIAALAHVETAAAKLIAELEIANASLAGERQLVAEQAVRLAAVERNCALAQAGYADALEEARRARAEGDALKSTLEHAEKTLSAERRRAGEQDARIAEFARLREQAETFQAVAQEEVRQLRAELAVQTRVAGEQSGMISQLTATHARAEAEGIKLSSRIEELEQALEQGNERAAQYESTIKTADARAATLEADLIGATHRVAEIEASYNVANNELLAIKRTPFVRLLYSIRRIGAVVTISVDRRLIRRSGLFDRGWYVSKYPEVDVSACDPLSDYLQRGVSEGREPGPLFSGKWYLEQYPEVRYAGMNPLVHFLRHGAQEGRNPSPFFDTEWYRVKYPDVRAARVNPLIHYVRCGAAEGRNPGPFFDTEWYLGAYPDVKAAGVNPLAHYLEFGKKECRWPNPTGTGPL